ncbi:mechanosensitive ion channel protein MscS [Prauserella marina]|uniref:Small conductance mechanosensitive channel n=1 Tax=Prauserella marina TaxID=530584 RepID=A0A222VM62_9PSEU|nr:mechanosensitive ion channel family protein [Prauserella marina]ASR35020.1 mechanosensitive ion channel protein MscS [Prauserella marina]PWV85248.1 small conductance mechanosensitive channel [Prauserella marina]SDC01431.1 small conductance mechanosensitive channel [Prauserella marina]
MDELLSDPPDCIHEAGTWCQQIWRVTGNEWLAGSANWLVAKPLRILLIVVVAILARFLVRKLIDRLTKTPENDDDGESSNGKLPALLRPLRERAPEVLGPAVIERRRQRAKTIGSVLKSLTTALVYGLAFVLILGELGINLAPIIASAGIVGVALGFGAQNLVRDFLSGIFMMLEDQYGVGDVVDVGEAVGTVESVGLRITTLRDLNGTVWYVRNGEVLRVGNSSQGYAVAVVDIPLGYNADVALATTVLQEVAAEAADSGPLASDVLETPEVLGVESVTPEGIQLRMTARVRPGRQWAVQRALRADIITALEHAGFEPPLGRFFGGSSANGG